ncbi:MAG TPA: capsular polysaccharide synthesis protein [Devosia sp.]|nr:capsular polysaccharide synthesis protein [Devosia sp.]
MTAAAAPDAALYSREDFQRFFRRKYLVLLKAAFDRTQRRVDFRDPAVIADVAAGFADLEASPDAHSSVPRRIFMLWQQGWNTAPALVRACAESWQEHNPKWELHLLDSARLRDYAPELSLYDTPAISRPAQSDIVRLELLRRHGGIWTDATLFCTRPLDDWLPAVAGPAPFIFSFPRPYRLVDVWFMAAPEDDPTIAALSDMARQYWRLFKRPHHYYWLPYLLEFLFEQELALKAAWNATPRLSALGPLAVHGNPFDRAAPRAIFDLIEANRVPVHKLSHKWRFAGPLDGTPVGTLAGLSLL